MKNPVLALVPSGYKTRKVYSVLPVNGNGDFDLIRNSSANRINKDGLIETIAVANVPRLNWDGECPSLLLEPQRTNVAYPNINLSGYSINNGNYSDNVIISPDGEDNGSLVQSNGGGTCVIYRNFGTSTNTTYNISVFLKKGNYNYIKLQEGFTNSQMVVDLSNGTEVSSGNATNKKIEDYGNGWYRVSFNYTSHSSITQAQYSVYINGSNASGNTFYTFGGQLEQGNYTTSYIKTEGSIATRDKETGVATGLYGDPEFNKNEGVVFIDVKPFPVDASDTKGDVISLKGGTYNQILFIFKTSNVLEFYVNNAPAPAIIDYDLAHNGGRIKAAIRWNNGNYSIFANGELLNSYLNTTRVFTDLETFQFQKSTDFIEFYGEVYGIQVFDEALNDNEIAKLTEL